MFCCRKSLILPCSEWPWSLTSCHWKHGTWKSTSAGGQLTWSFVRMRIARCREKCAVESLWLVVCVGSNNRKLSSSAEICRISTFAYACKRCNGTTAIVSKKHPSVRDMSIVYIVMLMKPIQLSRKSHESYWRTGELIWHSSTDSLYWKLSLSHL